MKQLTYAFIISACALLYGTPAQATPNRCEFIIVEIQQAVYDGTLTQARQTSSSAGAPMPCGVIELHSAK